MPTGYKELAKKFIEEIESGQKPAGIPLPSTRDLALSLGVSRDTVVKCYRLLQDNAYISADGPHGTFVSYQRKSDKSEKQKPYSAADLSDLGNQYFSIRKLHPFSGDFPEFNYGAVPKQALPSKRWRENLQRNLRSQRFFNIKSEPALENNFHRAIQKFLLRSKSIDCDLDQIFTAANSGSMVELLCRLLLNPGDVVAVEEPGFGGIKNIGGYQQLKLAPIPIDSEGLIVSELSKQKTAPRLVYVTASSHDPTGVTMSLNRRQELLVWARRNRAWIIDDDYDGNFKHGKSEIPSLFALDAYGLVIHISTFWQVLFPLTTASFALLPLSLVQVFKKSTSHSQGLIETFVSEALAEMLNDGYFHKHIRKWEKSFAARLRSFIYQAKRIFADNVSIQKQSGGLTCCISFSKWTEVEILEAAGSVGLPLISTSGYYMGMPNKNEFVVNFALLTEEQMKESLLKFERRLKSSRRAGRKT